MSVNRWIAASNALLPSIAIFRSHEQVIITHPVHASLSQVFLRAAMVCKYQKTRSSISFQLTRQTVLRFFRILRRIEQTLPEAGALRSTAPFDINKHRIRGTLTLQRHQAGTPADFSNNDSRHEFFQFIEFHRTVNALPDEANPNADEKYFVEQSTVRMFSTSSLLKHQRFAGGCSFAP